MANYRVRRLPVIDGHQLVGIVAQADVARALPTTSLDMFWRRSQSSDPIAAGRIGSAATCC